MKFLGLLLFTLPLPAGFGSFRCLLGLPPGEEENLELPKRLLHSRRSARAWVRRKSEPFAYNQVGAGSGGLGWNALAVPISADNEELTSWKQDRNGLQNAGTSRRAVTSPCSCNAMR